MTRKIFRDEATTKGCGQWYRTSSRRYAKLRASHIDENAKYDTGDFN